ncbi:MAG: GNAT family N-acetyltransferase [Anaerolineaceae bacterium]|nr:GNAT family N-acetyltransferase [Anaerolineaceae bacterium]
MVKFQAVPFSPKFIDSLIDLINIATAGRRNRIQISISSLNNRVLSHPAFDAKGLVLAIDETEEVVGAVHAIVPAIDIPPYNRLEGQGFIIGPYVRETNRRGGIGSALLQVAESFLKSGCDQINIHGLRAPIYHAQEGPRQPLFGSTEMMGLTWDDHQFLEFLRACKYEVVEGREISMLALLKPNEPSSIRKLNLKELSKVRITPEHPWEGKVKWVDGVERGYGFERFNITTPYHVIALSKGDTLVGHCLWYPMSKKDRAALFDLRVEPSFRGRGLGRYLIEVALVDMAVAGFREVELHTSPQRNPVAYKLYNKLNFFEVAEWLTLAK